MPSTHSASADSPWSPAADGALARRESRPDGGDDAGGDLVLDRFGAPVETLRPELEAARDVGQLSGDA